MKTIIIALFAWFFTVIYPSGNAKVITVAPDFEAEPSIAAHKLKTVQQVFNQLKNAKGDYRSRRPYLRFVKDSGGGPAVAYPKQGLILFEEKAFDICTSFGADSLNALANILSHELVHCYEKHDWEEYFAHSGKGFGLGSLVSDQALADEVQADYLGGFLAYQAGFQTFGIAPKFLEKVYKTYGLTDEMLSNYPKMAERQKMATQSEQQLKDLLDLFDMGNYMVALEEYDDALAYYLKVVEDFQSREVFNNIGVLFTLSAMKQFAPSENKFAYPVELDPQSRMRTGTKGGLSEEREARLMEALDYFEKARQYDAFYPPAYLNEGCAHALLGLSQRELSQLEWEDAEVAARRAIRLTVGSEEWGNTMVDAQVLLGILSSLSGDSTAAEGHFAEALKLDANHFLANTNLNALRGIKVTPKPTPEIAIDNEVIGDMPFNKISLDKTHLRGTLLDQEEHKLRLAVRSYDSSVAFMNNATTGTGGNKLNKNTFLQKTIDGYAKPTQRGIKLGSSIAAVVEKYGEPTSRINLSAGTWLRYKNQGEFSGILFQFDTAGRLTKWVLYRQVK